MNKSHYKSTYKTMSDSTVEDVQHIMCGLNKYLNPDYLTKFYSKLLIQLKDCEEGFPINRLEHSLQTATLAYRDGRDNEYVICALLHDVGEVFDPYSHDNIIAQLLKNYISEKNYFILKHHTTFQGFHYWDKIGLTAVHRII
jgi:predicted HD phosphohydrolase